MPNLGKIIYTFLILAFFASCAPPKTKKDDQMVNNNSNEITTLKNKILQLESLMAIQRKELNSEKAYRETNDPDYDRLKKNLDETREDLIRHITQLETKIDQRLVDLEQKYSTFKDELKKLDNKFVDLSEFEKIKQDLEKAYLTQAAMLELQRKTTENELKLKNIAERQEQLNKEYQAFQSTYIADLNQAIALWQQKLDKLLEQDKNSLSAETTEFILAEIQRIKIGQEALEEKITNAQNNSPNANTNYKNADVAENYSQEKQALEQLLKTLEEKVKTQMNENIVKEILDKEFAPCHNGLADNPYCYTLGSIITRLGGKFIDPTYFNHTKKDFIRYLTLSGVTIEAVVDYPSAYLVPSTEENINKFKSCHPEQENVLLLPPHKYWPRAIVISLVLENIENEIKKLKELNIIQDNIYPITRIGSWWRSLCYHNALNNYPLDRQSESDHLYAAAFDPYFSNIESFHYYENYIYENIWVNDVFNIVHPLASLKLNFSLGVGLGEGTYKNGQMHLGIASEVQFGDENGEKRDWPYGDYEPTYSQRDQNKIQTQNEEESQEN
ncbi:MAG: hypothetical protein QF441_01115 [Bacteriovoracaceae bacterium]|nr:hypothetical protein [Bacteriovoracaceae bacterium]